METIRLRPAQLPSHVLRAPLGREHVRTKTRNMPPAAAAARRCGFPTCYSAGLTLGQRHAHSPSPTQPSRFPDSQSQSRGPQSPRARSLPAHAMIIIGGSLSTALVMSAARRQETPDALGTRRWSSRRASMRRRHSPPPRFSIPVPAIRSAELPAAASAGPGGRPVGLIDESSRRRFVWVNPDVTVHSTSPHGNGILL